MPLGRGRIQVVKVGIFGYPCFLVREKGDDRKMKRKNKLLTIIMTLCLVATMMPIYTGVAFADAVEFDDAIIIAGKKCGPTGVGEAHAVYCITTSDGAVTVTTDSAIKDEVISNSAIDGRGYIEIVKTVSTDPTSTTEYAITMNNATVEYYNGSNNVGTPTSAAVYLNGIGDSSKCEIHLKGENTIIGNAFGIRGGSDSQHYILGDGTLTAKGERSTGILANNLTISCGGITASGITAILAEKGNINISGGAITASGGNYGISAWEPGESLSSRGNINISGGTVKVKVDNGDFMG